jgi:hypothetical protein
VKLIANFESGFSLHRLKGWNRALSSYGSTAFNVYSPAEEVGAGRGVQRGVAAELGVEVVAAAHGVQVAAGK